MVGFEFADYDTEQGGGGVKGLGHSLELAELGKGELRYHKAQISPLI